MMKNISLLISAFLTQMPPGQIGLRRLRIVLHIDPSREPQRARRSWASHLARAKWLTEHGYRDLLRRAAHD